MFSPLNSIFCKPPRAPAVSADSRQLTAHGKTAVKSSRKPTSWQFTGRSFAPLNSNKPVDKKAGCAATTAPLVRPKSQPSSVSISVIFAVFILFIGPFFLKNPE
jgi:hypothetical protein